MKSNKPELIVFSQNLMGGGASFHRNMLANKPDDFFEIKCIYLDPIHWVAARSTDSVLNENDLVFEFTDEAEQEIAKRLSNHISNKQGAVVANLPEELSSLHLFPKKNKTVFFICHDKGFLYLAKKHQFLIDVFIAHNDQVYQDIIKLIPHRKRDIKFIQHGVDVQKFDKQKNIDKPLEIVFLARHVKIKGIYELPKIDDRLLEKGISVNWTILGDGEERENFMLHVKNRQNFTFRIAKDSNEIIEILKKQDLYILPSSHDGLPVSLLESMSVGCVPIIYNFSEGIKKVVTEEIGDVLEIDDDAGMADSIEKYYNDRDLLFCNSKNCIAKTEKDFDIKKQANEYFSLYKDFKKHRNNHASFRSMEKKYSNKSIYIRKFFSLLKILKIYKNA